MTDCLPFDAVVGVSTLQLHALSTVGNKLDPKEEQSRLVFSLLVEALDQTLRQTYASAARATGNAGDATQAAAVWEQMSAFADRVLTVLSSLKTFYPQGDTPRLHDLALDYKLAAQRRAADDREEALCLSENRIPAGLFPVTK